MLGCSIAGARPGVFRGVQVEQLSSLLKERLQGAVVLVHDESAELWKEELDYPLVYGIREAKGLEFKVSTTRWMSARC